MNALPDRARRAAHRAAGRARRRLSGGEDGFVLLESIIAISLIAFIMAAVGAEFVSGVAAVARQRATQSAAQIADSAMGQIRALKPSDLVTGRGAASVQTQYAQGNGIATISPWLQKMDQASDTGTAPTNGANATIPTCDPTPRPTSPTTCTQKPGTVAYTVAQFLGTCWVNTSTASANCVPAAQKTTGSVQYLRAVVSVGWTGSTCSAGCYYVSSTLISADPDPTFRANQPPPSSPAIIVPGDQTSHVGDNVALQLSLQMGTGIPAYTWDLAAGPLPAGLTLSAGGRISGTVRGRASSTRVTVRITDGYGRQDTATFTWTVLPAPPVTACPPPVTLSNPSFEKPGVAAGAGSNVYNGTADLGWQTTSSTGQVEFWSNGGSTQSNNGGTAITAQDGSQWVEVNGSGMDTLYQDLPTTPGQVLQWSLWHRARNETGDVNAQDSIQVQMGSTTKPTAQVPSGATSPTISDGASGWVQYTGLYTVPAAQQITRFQVAAIATSSGSISIGNFVDNVRVTGVPCLSPAAQFSTVNTAIRPLQLQANQGSGSVTWSDDGTLPAGLSISASGLITGVPTTVGMTQAQLALTDQVSGYQQLVPFTWVVYAAPSISTPTAQKSSVGLTVGLAVTANCLNVPCTYSAANLPAGLTINPITGVVTGTPTTTGTTNPTLTITDAAGATATTNPFSWVVKAAPTLATPGNQTTTVGATVSVTVGSTCDNTPCSYTLNNPPAGLRMTGAGITGTPTTVATTTSTVTITDASGVTATSTPFTWTVKAAPTVTTPGNQTTTVGAAVSLAVGSTCANTPCTYTLNNPPAGLSMTGATITGTPTAVATTTSTVTVRDASGIAATSASFTWNVKGAPTVTAPANQTGSVGTAVNVAVTYNCPNGPCTYTLNNPPAGLSMTGATITGTPTAPGPTTSTITIRDASGVTANSASFTWTISAAPSTISSPGNQATTAGVAVSLQLTASCNYAPCTYSLSGQPAGLTISNSGLITGTPNAAGTSNAVTASITDAAGAKTTTASFSWTIYAQPTITTPSNQTSTVGTALILPVTSTCPNASCTYVLSGAPAGLTISATGRITGTPSATGSSNAVKVTITDAGGAAVSTATFTWTITAAPSVTAPANQTTANNAAVTLTLTKSCPNAPCAYALNGGPTGLSISSAGVVSGTVTSAPRTFSGVTITITDSSGVTATSAGFTWTVTTPLAGRWTFDEANGPAAADSSGGGHPATLAGGYGKTGVAVQGANALTLDGSTGAATTSSPVLVTSNSFTVSAWAKLNNLSGYQDIVTQDGTNVSAFNLQAVNGRFAFDRFTSDASSSYVQVDALATAVVGQWYQVTGVYNAQAGTIALYVNGVLQGTKSYTTGWNATGSFVIGRAKNIGLGAYLNGAIDDVRAYGTALSDEAVAQLAQAGNWRLDEGSGTTAQDTSLNNGNATLSGGASWTPGLAGSAVQFDGSSAAVTSSSTVIDTSQSFSVAAWAKADAATASGSNNGTVVSVDGTNVSGFGLIATGGKWSLARPASDSTSAATTMASASSSITAGQWYRLVGVYDAVAKTLTLYVNGVQQGSPVSFTPNWKATGSLVIGRAKGGSGVYWFGGAIDDVQAFQSTLDQAGVTALTTQTPPVPAAPTATSGAASATVSWTAPTPIAGSATTGYVVTPYLNGVAQTPVAYNSTATSQTLTGLQTGGSYTFAVAAVNINGASAASPVSGSVLAS